MSAHHPAQIAPTRSDTARVTTLELFFDLAFVLAITQCTSLMAHEGGWRGVGDGMLALALLWWGWVGFAWLTSVIDPELVRVRLSMFVAMAGLLVTALCAPHAFGSLVWWFLGAYGVVRYAHVLLFVLASRTDRKLRASVLGYTASATVALALLVVGAVVGGHWLPIVWLIAAVLDFAGPYVTGAGGWRLSPGHFAERHGLIVLIALGESIVAIGSSSVARIGTGAIATAVIGLLVAAVFWWIYFDVLSYVAERGLRRASPGLERNTMGRDAYSYLHFPMVAGIDLIALGIKFTVGQPSAHLHTTELWALLGGASLYLVGLAAFGWRTTSRISWDTLGVAALCIALVPLGARMPALATLGMLSAVLIAMLIAKIAMYGEGRSRVRQLVIDSGDSSE